MIIEWLYELKESIDKHGVRWGVLFALYAVYRKERRNYLLDQRDQAMFHNQRIIMDKLGVSEQWHGPVKMSDWDPQSLKRSYSSLHKGMHLGKQLRRGRKMLNKTWLVGLIGYIAFFVKQAVGVEVPDQMIDMTADIVLLLAGLIPMIVNMVKKKEAPAPQGPIPEQYENPNAANQSH